MRFVTRQGEEYKGKKIKKKKEVMKVRDAGSLSALQTVKGGKDL
jgi:hypothetical protein